MIRSHKSTTRLVPPKRRRTRLAVELLESRDCPSAYSIVDLLPAAGAYYSEALGLSDSGLAVQHHASFGNSAGNRVAGRNRLNPRRNVLADACWERLFRGPRRQ